MKRTFSQSKSASNLSTLSDNILNLSANFLTYRDASVISCVSQNLTKLLQKKKAQKKPDIIMARGDCVIIAMYSYSLEEIFVNEIYDDTPVDCIQMLDQNIGLYSYDGVFKILKGTDCRIVLKSIQPDQLFGLKMLQLDEKTMLLGDFNGNIKIIDLNSFEHTSTLKAHKNGVCGLTKLNNGRLCSGSDDKKVKFWDLQKMEKEKTILNEFNVGRVIQLSDGRITWISGKNLHFYDPKENTQSHLSMNCNSYSHSNCFIEIKNDSLVFSSNDDNINILDLKKNIISIELVGHTNDVVTAIYKDLDKQLLLTGGCDGKLISWNLLTGTKFRQHTENDSVSCLCNIAFV